MPIQNLPAHANKEVDPKEWPLQWLEQVQASEERIHATVPGQQNDFCKVTQSHLY